MFNLKEADGFVYRNYSLVLHIHSFLHSFHSEAQTVYMVRFPGVTLNPGKKDGFSEEVCLANSPQRNGLCGELVGIQSLKLSASARGVWQQS